MNDISKAIEIVKRGGVIIFPTDTAFGIGCRMDDPAAIKRVYEIRNRPPAMAVPVLFDSISRVEQYSLPIDAKIRGELMDKYWPGALTIVLNCEKSKVPSEVRGDGPTLGFRIPDHAVPLDIIQAVNTPLIAPSANFHGEDTPYRFEDLNKELIEKVDYVIEGSTKGKNLASTVVDCTREPWEVLRKGAVNIE